MAIKYCTHNANGSGDGTSISTPWTFAQALAGLTSADILYVCNTGTYSLTGAAKSWTNAGTDDSPLKIQGADASGETASVATLDGSGMTTGANMFFYGSANAIRYSNIRTTGARNAAHWVDTATNLWFHNCRVDNSVGSGVYSDSYTSSLHAFRSQFDHNGAWGLAVSQSQRGRFNLYRCTIDHNTSGGISDSLYIDANLKPVLDRCLIFRNGGVGVQFTNVANSGLAIIRACVISLNTSHGIAFPNSTVGEFVVEDSILSSNGGYGIYTANMTDLTKYLFADLCSYNNTSGHIDINSGTLPGTGNMLEDPAFVSETDGSEDFLATNPNLKKSFVYPSGGTSYFWIGAIQPQSASSSGGLGLNMGSMGVM